MSILKSITRKHQNIPLLKLLIKDGADVNETNRFNQTALSLACKYHQVSTVKFLLKHEAEVTDKCIHNAIPSRTKCNTILRLLLDHGGDPNGRRYKLRPLIWAIQNHDYYSTKILLEYKANVNLPDDANHPPIYYAIRMRNFEILKLLLEWGATLFPLHKMKDLRTLSARMAFKCLEYDPHCLDGCRKEKGHMRFNFSLLVILVSLLKIPLTSLNCRWFFHRCRNNLQHVIKYALAFGQLPEDSNLFKHEIEELKVDGKFPKPLVSYCGSMPYFQKRKVAFLAGQIDRNHGTPVNRFYRNRLFDKNVLGIIFSYVESVFPPKGTEVIRFTYPDNQIYYL